MNLVLSLFWVAAFADWWTTSKALRHGGSEGNPLVRLVLKLPWDTEWELAGMKLFGFLVFLWVEAPLWLWWWVVILQFVAAGWNAYLLKRAGLI